tara:strand:- start:517 stop:1212 length:696 start_codon:yes stop_codon:yes gene_type:complete
MPSWRNPNLDIIFNDYTSFDSESVSEMDVYQFGVFRGDSMRETAKILLKHKLSPRKYWGYDVFSGMPKETAEPIFQPSWDPDQMPDEFNVMSYVEEFNTPEECAAGIEPTVQSVFDAKGSSTKVDIVAGLVEDTLSKQDLKPAFYVDFDLDIYSPTKYAFKYMMDNNLIKVGTIVGYDDWGGTPEFESFKYGESRAHKEICDEYGLEMEMVLQNGNQFPHVQTVWVVTGGV